MSTISHRVLTLPMLDILSVLCFLVLLSVFGASSSLLLDWGPTPPFFCLIQDLTDAPTPRRGQQVNRLAGPIHGKFHGPRPSLTHGGNYNLPQGLSLIGRKITPLSSVCCFSTRLVALDAFCFEFSLLGF
eukprot:Gb_31819 [translate_table: standard]